MDLQITKAAVWVEEQVSRYPFSEIGVRLIVHNGEIKRIERSITEKLQQGE